MSIPKRLTLIFILLVLVGAWIIALSHDFEPAATQAQSSARQLLIRQAATPLPTPSGVTFGPITGADYTPVPLHTAVPSLLSERRCEATVVVPELTLYSTPDQAAQSIGAAGEYEVLVVSQISADTAGNWWASTERGWFTLQAGADQPVRLNGVRACEILWGHIPPTTLMGLHILNDSRNDVVLRLVRRLADGGHPIGTLKGLNGTEQLLNEAKQISPQTVIVYRSLLNSDGFGDCPQDARRSPDPVATARRWIDGLDPHWSAVNADYYEVVNECVAELGWFVQFAVEMMKIANEQGRCLLLFSFGVGSPEQGVFDTLLPAYQYVADHPCQPGRTHAIAMHAYSLEDDRLISESDIYLAGRHRLLHDYMATALPYAADLPIYLTEVGIGWGDVLPTCEVLIRDVLQYTHQLEETPYVRGFHLWNVGSGPMWVDITPCLPSLGESLVAYYERGRTP